MARSAAKATTFKIGTVVINLTALTYALGGPVGGGVVAAGTAVTSWAAYAVNDYAWDSLYPPPPPEEGKGFDAKAEAWRTTLKFLTYKPLGLGQKLAWMYAWTGSTSILWTWGLGLSFAGSAWFYANEMAWDWYDWYTAEPQGPTQARVAEATQGFPQAR